MNLLLHICCAHCLEAALAGLREEYGNEMSVNGYFHNPNIHPLLEFRKRLKAVKVLGESLDLTIHYDESYGLELFLQEVWQGGKAHRCRRCYRQRLMATAKMAYESGFDTFSSTLCTSLHQSHRDLRHAGADAGGAWGVEFLYRDWRPTMKAHQKRRGIYSQQYCGCVFSEEDRYKHTNKELYRGPGGHEDQ